MILRKTMIPVLLLLLSFPLLAFQSPIAHAAIGRSVDDPGNVFSTTGPRVNHLLFNYYASDQAERNDFEVGRLDLTDWPNPLVKYASYDANPDLLHTPTQPEYGMVTIEFNEQSQPGYDNHWVNWGCNMMNGNSLCGIEIRQAIAHLVDRPNFVANGPLQGTAQALADPTPPAKGLSSSLTDQCSWDTLFSTCTDAYNIAPDPSGFATPGSPDFCSAADHMIQAGVATGKTAGTCVLTGINPGVFANHLRFMIRNDDPVRVSLANGLQNAINQLFGGTVVVPSYGSITSEGYPIVFSTLPIGPPNDWEMYTGYWSLPGPFADHLERLYSSVKASDQCGGIANPLPLNYGFVCIPEFDLHATAAAQASTISTFNTETLAALNVFGKHAANIPVYSRNARWVALRSVGGLVNERGTGYPNFWTSLNGQKDPSYVPANPIYTFGGGDSSTMRWGQRQGTNLLNPFLSETPYELTVLGEVYDTLFKMDPIHPDQIINWMAGGVTKSVDQSGNAHFLIQLCPGCLFHDQVPVSAADIKFTLLNFRDSHASAFYGYVELVLDVNIINPSTVDVTMQGQSVSHIYNLARVPIVPQHIWDSGDNFYGQGVGRVDSLKIDTSYDPIASGTLIGSGPFLCQSPFGSDLGKIGTGCSRNADGSRAGEALSPGGVILLTAFPQYISHPCTLPPPPPQLGVSKFFTDTSNNLLPLDGNGNPKVDVVIAGSIVRSTNPGEIIAWVNLTNTASEPVQSLMLNESLPVDWIIAPGWLPAKGAIHVYNSNTTSLSTNPDITQPNTITVTSGNPQTVRLAIPDISNTAIGHPLLPGETILLAVKLDYALAGTQQPVSSYPRNYTDIATGAAWTQASYTGTQFSGSQTGFFTAYAKVVGDVNGDCKVDIIDLSIVGGTFGKTTGQAGYSPNADLNNDGKIDIIDLSTVGGAFGS